MELNLKDKILNSLGCFWYCDTCGVLFVSKKQADEHGKKCKEGALNGKM